mmetsp:Transcript_2070/g.8724  ORF Transcript_2070/g.8724 Transcript_2070/m.8724 type:complete len:532 (-) Transcript_2070:51-1646(-)
MATDDHMKIDALGLPPGAEMMNFGRFDLENGFHIDEVTVGYTTYGTLNEAGDNAIIVGHSLTSNSMVNEWWGELLGAGDECSLDTESDFIVCCNYLGSPYGSSSPVTPDPAKPDGRWYAADFPTPVTIRDNVRLQRKLLDHLGVKHLRMAIGGSMGSMLALEWAATYPDFVTELVLIAGCGRHTDWAIGIGEAQRFSIMADAKYKGGDYDPNDQPKAGLATSRMMAMLSYRAPASVDERFSRSVMGLGPGEEAKHMRKPSSHVDLDAVAHANESAQSLPYFQVESYLQYQGKKFIRRFDANCYIQLTYTLDSHDVARDRGEYFEVLRRLTHRTLVVGITSDVLYPFQLQTELAQNLPNAEMYAIDSPHGHDAFLIEIKELNKAIVRFRRGERADPNVAHALGTIEEGEEKKLASGLESVAELRGAVLALEDELAKSKAREELEARRGDALLAQVMQLKHEMEEMREASVGGRLGEDGGVYSYGGGTVNGAAHGLRVLPANPPMSARRFQPVFGRVKSEEGGNAPATALGAF